MSNLLTPHLQPIQYAGSFMGADSLFSVSGETEGKVLKRIRVSRLARSIRAIEVWLTGDSNPRVFGDPSGAESSTFDFSEGERITRLQLQNNQQLGLINVGRIRLDTSRFRTFEFGMSVQPTGQVITVDVGSGVCVGMRGVVALSVINMLGFVFLRPIQSVRLHGVEYPTINSTSTITTTILEELPATLKNDDDHEPLHWVLAGSRQFVTSSTWRTQPADLEGLVSYLLGSTISINIDLGIDTPKLVATGGTPGASTTFRWETARIFPSTNAIQGSIADLTVSTDQYSVWCHVSDTLAPAQSLITRRAALVGQGHIDNLQCSARIQVFTNTSSGSVLPFAIFTFPIGVLYSARTHSDVQILS